MREIELITLKSETGFIVQILSLGGIIHKILAKNKNDLRKNIVLSYDTIEDYMKNDIFLGCAIGPIAGRTENGLIKIDDLSMQLDTSCHPNSLHSCSDGLHLVNWNIKSQSETKLVLTHQSQSFNGSIQYEITYSVNDETLTIEYFATTTSPVYLSLTNHSYFNLTGDSENQISNHMLKLNCTHYAKLNEDNLPIQLVPLKNTVMDYTVFKSIKDALYDSSVDIALASGIDHPFRRGASDTVAELMDPESGIIMKVQTTQPYVVIYTGNFLSSATSTSGKVFGTHTGICFETQDLPNISSNKLDIIKTVTPENPYKHVTSFAFYTF